MECSNCSCIIANFEGNISLIHGTKIGDVEIKSGVCPNCTSPLVNLSAGKYLHDLGRLTDIKVSKVIYPLTPEDVKINELIPNIYSQDLLEAGLIINISPKASAALSRRCLQNFIRAEFGIIEKTLFTEIDLLINKSVFPSYINDTLHAIREIGNFAAHPLKDTSTGEVVDVEPGEAEWIFSLLISMLELHFVQGSLHRQRMDALNTKLISVGKKPLRFKN